MKKIFTLIISIGIATTVFSQTQRMVLTEEFTNASCPPCAVQDVTFNELLLQNTSKIIAIKYQTSFPGNDPMNMQTQTDVAPRATYYVISGVPFAPINGSTTPLFDWVGTGYDGGPYHYNQEMIDSAYASPSPFILNVTHTISSDLDSIYITATITAAQTLSGLAQPKLRLAIVENEIIFNVPPGSDGTTNFYNVMRKMVPNATGTSLLSSWTNGQTQTFTYGLALPSYIYNSQQIKVVGFIQTDGDKVVHQAYASDQFILPNYATIPIINSTENSFTCNSFVTPSITIANGGTNPITSALITYSIDGQSNISQNYTGNIAFGSSQNVAINNPIINLGSGQHTLVFQLQNINGMGINTPSVSNTFYVIDSPSLLNDYTEDFANATGFNSFIKLSDDNVKWTRSTTSGFGSLRNSMGISFYNSPAGKVDDVILPPFSTIGLNNPTLNFKVAGAGYPNVTGDSEDTLEVHYSLDCGSTWNLAWRKIGSDLYTVATQTTSYTANSDAAFRNESTTLVGAEDASQLLIMFRGRSNYGNNVYVDNINITASGTLVSASSKLPYFNNSSVKLYPNPSENNLNIAIENIDSNAKINIVDAIGKSVSSSTIEGKDNVLVNVDLTNISNGIYFVKVNSGGNTSIQKLIVKH